MKIGAIVPQGWVGEYDGWDPLDAWRRTTEVARQAERLGFESIWLFDHFHTVPRPTDEITFESFTSLSALAALTDPGPARPHRHLHRVPQPGAHGQDDLDDGFDQRRPDGARDRRRLEARRMARLRLRLPRDEGAAGPARRRPRGHHPDARRRQAPARDLRGPATPRSATRSTSPSRSSSRASRSWSVATGRTSPGGSRPAMPTSSISMACRRPRSPRHSP